ncbi:T-cell immunomodulatory protein [Desmophyllum pertusum]|uniref:T-cell immunomodulatory protein n=1 Tax=Desmophyllum pertusum TaxID=174260 RepID=A0A9W9Z752_9CNID|nr:T-cell immunomodulatory protein [Desmophyllum pertusum]
MRIPVCFGFLVLLWRPVCCTFIDVTERVGISAVNGYLAAFGDFNGDKQTDLFLVTNGGKRLEIFFWNESDLKFSKGTVTISLSDEIVNVTPSDFDGDGCLDILITTKSQNAASVDKTVTVYVYWGNLETIDVDDFVSLVMRDQPLIMDANGDLLPDLFGTVNTENSSLRSYWISSGSNRSFDVQPQTNSSSTLAPVRVPHSNAFLDLSGDFTADLYVTNDQDKGEIWINKEGILVRPSDSEMIVQKITKDIKHIGQSTFADIDGDGDIELLLPVCTTDYCEESHIYVYSNGQWLKMLSNDKGPVMWQFIPPSNQMSSLFPLMTIRTGDYNMDSFNDAVVVLNVKETGDKHYKRVVALLENVPCQSARDICFRGRTFEVQWEELPSLEGAVLATFADLFEDGTIGIIGVTESIKGDDPKSVQYHLHAMSNNLYTDACFLKVIVLGGRTLSSCRNKNLPYGVNQIGSYIKYTTTSTDGKVKYGSAAQLSQSAYFALQCPYTVFGLGRTPNFVDELAVGIPRSINSPERKQVWPSIIPNSQVIVIPYPPDSPSSWTAKLLVTPSKLVLLTGVSLLGICVFIGLIILLLHLKEKREDQKAKRQDAHKFHFDAM